MRVALLALWSDSLTYTLARALAFDGHEVAVWIADGDRDRGSKWSLSSRIASIEGVSVILDGSGRPLPVFDRLVVQGSPLLLRHRNLLDMLASQAALITAVSAGDRSGSYRQALQLQWRERRWYGRWFSKVRRVVYKDGYYPVDLVGLSRSRRVIGFDAHSKFLQDGELFRAIHASDWQSDARRPIRANFLGSRDPEVRSRILDGVEPFFTFGSKLAAGPASGQRMVWHAYSDQKPAALSPLDFLTVLTDSDFTLAPPGYSLVTHRPVEALLRGSIPVLNADELDLYNLDLVDGVNCLAVPARGWGGAMQRILGMSQEDVVRMRRNIAALVPERVTYAALARDLCRRLGVT